VWRPAQVYRQIDTYDIPGYFIKIELTEQKLYAFGKSGGGVIKIRLLLAGHGKGSVRV
jgi:hypothetical protein